MKGNNLHGNRVSHDGDNNSNHQADTHQPDRSQSKIDREKQSAQEGAQKATKAAGSAIGGYFGGGVGAKIGGKVGDTIGKSRVGQQLGRNFAKNPLTRKALSKANDSGALDAANNATDLASINSRNAMRVQHEVLNNASQKTSENSNSNGSNSSTTSDGSSGSQASGSSGFGFSNPFSRKSKSDFSGDDSSESKGSYAGMFDGILSGNIAVKIGIISIVAGFFLLFLLFLVLAQGTGIVAGYEDAFGVSSATGGDTGGLEYSTSDQEAEDFFDRVNAVKQQFQMQGKSFNAVYISAVYTVLNQNGAEISYEDMTTSVITDIANGMFSGNSYNEDTFRYNLVTSIFPSYLPNRSRNDYETMTDEVFQYYEDYLDLIDADTSSCASLGSCVYSIKGFYLSDRGNVSQQMTISDLKVRLMECSGSFGSGDWNTPLAGEELVPFEQYILGVSYQEIGPGAPDEAIKAQMVAARSYSLARPLSMGNAQGKKLEQENGQWILQLSSCVADQVYCNPDLGCSAMNDGQQYGTVRSGVNYPVKLKDPLPENHKMRTLANATMGEVLVNEQGNIISAGYVSSTQNRFIDLANQGLNYRQILLQVYGASNIDKMNCNNGSGSGCASTGSAGPYSGWKQTDPAWKDITIGTSSETIGSVGCLATSVSMLIAKSGVATTVNGDFNPGTFVQKLNQTGGFTGALLLWNAVSNAAPNFVFQNKVSIDGQTQQQKLATIQNLLNQGYYVVAQVKGYDGEHWVAIDGVEGNRILMMDPGSQSTDMWNEYIPSNTIELAYFQVTA